MHTRPLDRILEEVKEQIEMLSQQADSVSQSETRMNKQRTPSPEHSRVRNGG